MGFHLSKIKYFLYFSFNLFSHACSWHAASPDGDSRTKAYMAMQADLIGTSSLISLEIYYRRIILNKPDSKEESL